MKKSLLLFGAGVFFGVALGFYGTKQFARSASEAEKPQQLSAAPVCEPGPVSSSPAAPEPTPPASPQVCPSCPPAPACPSQAAETSATDLPAPEFDERTPATVSTNPRGEAHVRWLPVEGARRYQLDVINERDRVVRSFRTRKTFAFVKDIPVPTGQDSAEYKFKVSAIDTSGKKGEPSEERILVVYSPGRVVAPSIKVITVED